MQALLHTMESGFRRRWEASIAPSSRSREPESHAEERNFSPPALSKAGCWGFMTQAMIHALVSSFLEQRTAVRQGQRGKSTTTYL